VSVNLGAEKIAVVGIGCRFPGNVTSPGEFWDLLIGGVDGVRDVPEGRWDLQRFFDPEDAPGRMYVRKGGFLNQDIRQFDPMFFGISPREADFLDPQQRLLLEVAWEAIDDAGLDADRLIGSPTGVYVGGFMMDSMVTQLSPLNRDAIGPHTAVGFTLAMLANRISFTFDLRGPSVSMDTACSSSLVATHLACQALWNGDCSVAMVGGVNVMHRPEVMVAMCKGKFLAKDGRSKSFDAAGDGYGRGEGAGMVILKPLSKAVAAGDRIYATICASGCNQDGHTDGITVPNPNAQAALIEQVCARARMSTADIRMFEAHGTGTAVGDPLEANALGEAIGRTPGRGAACVLGSVKANIGHLEAAAGVAGLIKTALSLHHSTIPPLANLVSPNPEIDFDGLGLRLPVEPEALPDDGRPCLAGINSFGYGGTNAHVLMERFSDQGGGEHCNTSAPYQLVASARDPQALKEYVAKLRGTLAAHPAEDLPDLVYSSARRRTHHEYRLALVTSDREHALAHLDAWLANGFDEAILEGRAPAHTRQAPVFVFTGMGPQWWAMGRELYRDEPVFRACVDHCDEVFQEVAGWSIRAEMQADEDSSRIGDTTVAQPANFVIQAALTELWAARGIRPAAVVGHSVGEVTSGYVAGCYDLTDAIRISYHRSRLQKQAAGKGGMLALGCGDAQATLLAEPHRDLVSVAAINSPTSVTLSGDRQALERIAVQAESQGLFNRMLEVEVPYHSPAMEPLKQETRACLADLRTSGPKLPLYSTVRGVRVEEPVHDAEYWCDNIREPVFFAKAITALVEDGHRVFLEVGPHPVLSTAMKQSFAALSIEAELVASMRRGEDESAVFAHALAALYRAGSEPDWEMIYPKGRFLRLPTYPWQRREHWNETEQGNLDRLGKPAHALLQRPVDAPNHIWLSDINGRTLRYLQDHKVQGLVVLPGAAYVETALALQQQIFDGGPCVLEGLAFRRALVVDASDEPEYRVEGDAEGAFRIHSRPRSGRSDWVLNAEGRIVPRMPKAMRLPTHAELLARCTDVRTAAEHYEDMRGRGLDYGPAFQGIAELHRGDGEVLAMVTETDADSEARLAPTKLDACFQALLAAMPGESGTFLPTGIRKLVYRRRSGTEFWCHGHVVTQGSDWLEADLHLYDAEGPIAEVLGLHCQEVPSAVSAEVSNREGWTYRSVWNESERPMRTVSEGRYLVMGLGSGVQQLTDALQFELGIQADAIALDDAGPATAELAERFATELQERLTMSADTGLGYRGVILDLGRDRVWHDPILDPSVVLLRLIQELALLDSGDAGSPRLYLVTRGAQPVFTSERLAMHQGALIGLMRVAGTEHPGLRPSVVDLDAEETSVAPVVVEVLADSNEDAAAWRGFVRYVQRLERMPMHAPSDAEDEFVAIDDEAQFELRPRRPKDLESVQPVLSERPGPRVNEVEIRVQSCAVLPRDLFALTSGAVGAAIGAYFDHRPGSVAVGSVTRVGAVVTGICVGDRYVVCMPDAMCRYLCFDPDAVFAMKAPEAMSSDQLAVSMLPYLTAMYGVETLGRLTPGETVLVHHTSGGASLAAIQVARLRGARVIATVSGSANEPLEGLAELIHVDEQDLESRVATLTEGRGADLVIDFHNRIGNLDVSVLGEFGRLVSIPGVRPQRGETIGWLGERHDLSLMVTDLESLMAARPRQVRETLDRLRMRLERGELAPLAVKSFTLADLPDTFAFLAESRWPGGVAIDLGHRVRALVSRRPSRLFNPQGSYLITGAFGGFGLSLARWMAKEGAGELILISRRGEADPAAAGLRRDLEALGSRVDIRAVDVTDRRQVMRLVEETTAVRRLPLRGIMHTAAILDDAPLAQLDAARLAGVFGPKVDGALHLHEATRDLPLDHFVLFSSVSALIGNAGQGNYVSANCLLDGLAHHRRHLGLTATSINWGALRDAGMAASSNELAQYLERIGMRPFSADDALEVLGRVLAVDEPQVGILDLDWQRWKLAATATAELPRFSALIAEGASSGLDPEVQARRDDIMALDPEARRERVCEHLVMTLAKVLRLPTDRIVPELSLANLGVDSLMNMELVVALQQLLGIEIGALELMQGGGLIHIAEMILQRIGDGQDCAGVEPASVARSAEPDAGKWQSQEERLLGNLDSLDDADVDRLLKELA